MHIRKNKQSNCVIAVSGSIMNRLLRLGPIVLLAVFLLALVSLPAQIQRQISYQGLLTQPTGLPVLDGSYILVTRLYSDSAGANLVFEETHNNVQVTKGLFSLYIGAVTSMANVDFSQQLWLELEIKGNAPFVPRTKLAVVPYAIRAERADKAGSLDDNATGFVKSLNGGQGNLVIKGESGLSVNRDGDTIRITPEVSITGIEQITSVDNTIAVTNPIGPVTDLGIRDGAISTQKLADGAVTSSKLGDNSVSTSKLIDASVTITKLAPGIIPTTLPPSGPAGGDLTGTYPNPLIAPNAVNSAKIADGTILTQDLANGSVTTLKLADLSVTTPKIADESVTNAKLTPTGVTPGIYGSNLLIPRITVDDRGRITDISQQTIPDIPFTGPAGGDLTGMFPDPLIGNLKVTTPKLADGAVNNSKLGANAVTTDKILNGTILPEDLAFGVVPISLPPSGPAGGALTGTYPNPNIAITAGNQILSALNAGSTSGTLVDARLPQTSVTPGTYGDGANGKVPRITVDQWGRITAALNQDILSAAPTGAAGGDLQGNYPAPLINPTAGAGSRIVDAIRTDYLNVPTDPDINTPNNVVVLDGSNRLPAANGSQLTNLNAGAITSGILPIAYGGTNSGTALNNNRIMVSNNGKIVEGSSLSTGQFLVSPTSGALPQPGSIVAGAGISVNFATGAPYNFTITSTDARILPGTADNQTVRWDALNSQWEPNTNLLATEAGDVTANGNMLVNGTATVAGSATLGTNAGTSNSFGPGANASNTMGSNTATNYIYGNTYINVNAPGDTYIGNISHAPSSTTIGVGLNGNLTLLNIISENPEWFVTMNINNHVRKAQAGGLALEGIQWQNGAFRLGSENTTINPLMSTRYVNLNDEQLRFTRIAGTGTMLVMDGAANTLTATAITNINTTGADVTTIGNPASNTIIGGQLDPRGNITNTVGDVVIMDQTEIIGPTFINIGTNDNVEIGNLAGIANQSVSVSVGQGANGNLLLHNVKTDPAPIYMLSVDNFDRVRKTQMALIAQEGLIYEGGAIRLGTTLAGNAGGTNPLISDRIVNLDDHSLTFNRGGGSDPMVVVNGNSDNVTVDVASVTVNNLPTGIASDDVLMIDGTNQVKRISSALIGGGALSGRKLADEVRLAGGVFPDANLTANVAANTMYEVEVYVQYSGSNSPLSALDLSITAPVAGPADISYGVVTSGQAIAPSNVDGSGTVISGIGVDFVPSNRQTVVVKGLIQTNAIGSVTFNWGDSLNSAGESVTIHRNSYIKLTRLN